MNPIQVTLKLTSPIGKAAEPEKRSERIGTAATAHRA
jgi:hypothetical protein